MTSTTVQDLERIKQEHLPQVEYTDKTYLMVCGGTGCHSTGSIEVIEALHEEISKQGLKDRVEVVETGCNGFCAMGPILVVEPEKLFYQKLSPEDIPELVEQQLLNDTPVERLLFKDQQSKKVVPKQDDIPFFAHQLSWALRNKGRISPESLEQYIARDGYFGAAKALHEMTPEQIIEEIKTSGLRGRGGAGFPAHLKWNFAYRAEGDIKYVLCNADEGDPGAFMDRSILEADPHAVLEGMIIAAKAIGASQGYIYCRTEYPLAIRRLQIAIRQARERGLLGENILNSGFSFDLDIYQGAGAFVCGEETALMRSIEGKRGMPRPRPPFPAHKGLFERPTILNNVETLANVGQIMLNGGSWYSSVGTETSKGTKVFALSGDINNIGLVEVPMGTPLRTIIYDIGGGIPRKQKLKAVQLGGPSGGCVSEDYLDLPVDYEAIVQAGAIMGSGGMIVMDQNTCMVDMARFFMDFCKDESCGKCTPCREGTPRMLELLDKIKEGRGEPADLTKLEELSSFIQSTSLCGLGQTAPNPILSTLTYFRDEYEAHIYEKRCPAKRCADLLEFVVDTEKCTSCGLCYKFCPVGAVSWKKKEPAEIDRDKCIKCMTCIEKCRFDAIY
jgi:NADH-quinone oxidoreductase subunit F/NAD(P)H dehydrogenase (quinone)/NADP-reducing hydrogenase subunit HndC